MTEDELAAAKALESRIAHLEQETSALFSKVHSGKTWKDSVLVWAAFIGIGVGLMGLVATLIEGLSLPSAGAMAIGGVTFWRCRDAEKRTTWNRQRLDSLLREIEECKQRHKSVTAPARLKDLLEGR